MIASTNEIIDEIKTVVVGKDDVIAKVLMAILSRGHILLEDIPGVGKTTLALAFSKAMNLQYNRLQFTPDVMPSDVTGFSVYNKDTEKLEYRPGPALCNLFLADEINRASSKTQSALLEVMEEGSITTDGITRKTPNPYIVIATQNPLGFTGTQMLPESQLDRFMICLSMGYPHIGDEVEIMKRKQGQDSLELIKKVADKEDIIGIQQQVDSVYVSDAVYDYIARLTAATRQNELIRLGISPRGSIALVGMAKACAFLARRDYVIPHDVQCVFYDVGRHRIVLGAKTRVDNVTVKSLLKAIFMEVPSPVLSTL